MKIYLFLGKDDGTSWNYHRSYCWSNLVVLSSQRYENNTNELESSKVQNFQFQELSSQLHSLSEMKCQMNKKKSFAATLSKLLELSMPLTWRCCFLCLQRALLFKLSFSNKLSSLSHRKCGCKLLIREQQSKKLIDQR